MRTRAGYAGGKQPKPTYRKIGDHTEAIAVDFDPAIISYQAILELVWQGHNPLRSIGGNQYRNAIWYMNEEQKGQAEQTRAIVAERLKVDVQKIVTELEPAGEFTYAEDYHQKYILRRHKDFIDELEGLFSDYIAFTDSTVATRLNGWFGNPSRRSAENFRNQVATWGLPDSLSSKVLAKV